MTVSLPRSEPTRGSALAYASFRVLTTSPGDSVADVLSRLRTSNRLETSADIAVVEEGRLVGLIPIEDLLAASDDTPASSIMDPDPPVIGPGASQEKAAAIAVTRGESSLAVVDETGLFMGLIPPHRMLGVLLDEHHEDLARLSGYLHQSSAARSASEEGVTRRLWHRFPWLAAGLASSTSPMRSGRRPRSWWLGDCRSVSRYGGSSGESWQPG